MTRCDECPLRNTQRVVSIANQAGVLAPQLVNSKPISDTKKPGPLVGRASCFSLVA